MVSNIWAYLSSELENTPTPATFSLDCSTETEKRNDNARKGDSDEARVEETEWQQTKRTEKSNARQNGMETDTERDGDCVYVTYMCTK